MVAVLSADLISELDRVAHSSPANFTRIVGGIIGLLTSRIDRLEKQQMAAFDEILTPLADLMDVPSLMKLSGTVATCPFPELRIARKLAGHDRHEVAEPVLARYPFSDADLIEIARTRGEQHCLAIARRPRLPSEVVEVLLGKALGRICILLCENAGAAFSPGGFVSLARMAACNDDLADLLVKRTDVPADALKIMLAGVPRSVRARLLKLASDELRPLVEAAIGNIETEICYKSPGAVDYSQSKAAVDALNKCGKLNDSAVNRFAIHGEYRNLVVALSELATVPVEIIESLLHAEDSYGLVVACRASRLNSNTALSVIKNRPNHHPLTPDETTAIEAAFEALTLSAAQRMIRFGAIREVALTPGTGTARVEAS